MVLIGTSTGLVTLDGEALIEGTRINHVARYGDDWWAVDGKGQVHKNGEVVATMPESATPLCIQPTPDTIWIGATEGRLYGYENGVITEDEFFANAPGRDNWYTPWGAPADVRSMAIDADQTLYINVHVGGVLRYDNTGVVPTLDVNSDVHQVGCHPTQQGAVFAATAYGLAVSHNGHDFEIRSEGLHAEYCRAVAVLNDSVLVSASTGPTTDRGRLYRSGLWEDPLTPVSNGLPEWFNANLNTHCLVVSEGAVYAGLDDTVWRSDDSGESWAVAKTGLPKITCLA